MATLQQIIVMAIKRLRGGIVTDEDDITPASLIPLAATARAFALQQAFQVRNRRIHPDWAQTITHQIDIKRQDIEGCSVFALTPWLSLGNSIQDGLIFIGNSQCPHGFTRARDLADLGNIRSHHIMSNFQDPICVAVDNEWRIYHRGPRPKSFITQQICRDPRDAPGFNVELDRYPIDEDSIPVMIQYLVEQYLAQATATATNATSNSRDDQKSNQQQRSSK